MTQVIGTTIDFETDIGVERSPLHQIRPEKGGETLRIAILSSICKPRSSHYHWHRNSFYRCNTEEGCPPAPCCKIRRSWTCACLAMVYLSADSDGRLPKDADIRYRIGYISLSENAARQVKECAHEARGCDLLYSKTDGYYSFHRARRIPAWKGSPQAAKVEQDAGIWSDGKKLEEKLGKQLSDTEWQRFLKTGYPYQLED